MYPTADELVAESQNVHLTALDAERQQELYDGAVLAVEEYCGQRFDFEEAAEKILSGPGTTVIYLPKRLETLTFLDVFGNGLVYTDVVVSDEKDRITVKKVSEGAWGYYEQALYELDGSPPRKFTYGTDTVAITGDWGWSEFPAPVRTALRRDMEDTASADANLLSDTVAQFRRIGLRDVAQGNLRASITGASGLSPMVTRLLQPFVWPGPIGIVV